jgi:hypothetical protein
MVLILSVVRPVSTELQRDRDGGVAGAVVCASRACPMSPPVPSRTGVIFFAKQTGDTARHDGGERRRRPGVETQLPAVS